MTDAAPPPERSPASFEVDLDVAAFLPEGSSLEAVDETEPASVAAQGGAGPATGRPAVDVAALERIEADLAAVDAALVAIDAGEPGSSPLLAELLADGGGDPRA